MVRRLILIVMLITATNSFGSHVLGGDITWVCQGGGNYVFQLVFYRDCNGADVNTVAVDLGVWNHPTVSQIQALFVSREDVSPVCTQVSGGPTPLDCGSGAFGGNGMGAIEKVVYRSNPVTLSGTPPADGWIITYKDFSRNIALTNLQSPASYGITLASTMYAIPGSPGGCIDNSPQFLQEPFFASCVGEFYEYNMNPVDIDLDSLSISFGQPMDRILGSTYNPPSDPVPVPWEPGFSVNSPTPGTSMNAGNIPASLNPSSGNLTFLSNNSGNFAVKLVTQSFRQGVLIAEVEREMQLIVQNCTGTNNPPVVGGPFAGSFETTVNAGDLVNFTLSSTDVELLQDGSPQNNILTATGLEFGPDPTLGTGCAVGPCATIDALPPISAPQGVSSTFNWQTTCDHLVNPYGFIADEIPYHFVFKIQDDFCPIPKVKYATVTINVVNPDVIGATAINCVQTATNGDITISWDPVTDINGSFASYELQSVQNGSIASITNIATSSFTIPAPGQQEDYLLAVGSACFGSTYRYADTTSNIHLNLNNPVNGTAILQWNDPISPKRSSMGDNYHIYREYPSGTWTLYDSVPYGTTTYIDTITICSAQINYQIVLPNSPCDFTSNIVGDVLEDLITPDIPVIYQVSIDTATNKVEITWNENGQEDTYGYVIYTLDNNGFVVPFDTVWGISNTTYVHSTNTNDGPLTYTVAAFDSCWTSSVPPTYQTSAKALLNTTSYLTTSLNICSHEVTLKWSNYIGWSGIDQYEVFVREGTGNWVSLGTTNDTTFVTPVQEASNYCFVVQGSGTDFGQAFSNTSCIYIPIPTPPAFNYLQVATVNNETVSLTHYIDNGVNVSAISIQRENNTGNFVEITRIPVTGNTITYTDSSVDVSSYSYKYRVQVVDSCLNLTEISNEAETILLNSQVDNVLKHVYLSWTGYGEFDGSILGYAIYRGVGDQMNDTPIATVPNGQYYYNDDINSVISNGTICYHVEAIEAINSFGFAERSVSNVSCIILEPTIYIPNSFTPDGNEINQVFQPVIWDIDPTTYQLVIYNRRGQPIYTSNDPNVGWNGIIDSTGKMAQDGTYLYTVSIRDGNGLEILKRGHVNLFK